MGSGKRRAFERVLVSVAISSWPIRFVHPLQRVCSGWTKRSAFISGPTDVVVVAVSIVTSLHWIRFITSNRSELCCMMIESTMSHCRPELYRHFRTFPLLVISFGAQELATHLRCDDANKGSATTKPVPSSYPQHILALAFIAARNDIS